VAVFLADTTDGGYRRVDRWRWEPDVNNGLVIHGACTGTPVRVTYAVEPGTFPLDVLDVESADFGETTGLPDRLADLLTLGVAYRLAPMADMTKLTATGVDVRSDDTKRPEAGVRLQQAFYRQFQARIQQEQLALHQQHPIRVHGQRGL